MRSFVLLSLLLLSFIACKKDSPAVSLKKEIAGKWELKTRYGGWIGTQNFSPGNGNTLEFAGNNYVRVNKINDSTYSDKGSFEIYGDKACNGVGETMYVKFIASVSANDDTEDIDLQDGELIIGQSSCIADGATSIYTRLP